MTSDALELWGGVECTVNRVGDVFRDQTVATGHHHRDGDLALLAPLGLKAIRYPVLWERVSPDWPDARDWRWSDARLAELRGMGLRVIAGLVHHGSGPRYTNLLDDGFAPGLAEHARAVAERYPWIADWTPVNEPVTTARFSALYGHWYPHARDEAAFWRALINQIDATRLAMRAIRRVNPAARLIQTDDLGRTYATAALRDQAAYDNQRRRMGWDLLCGRVTPAHPFWRRLCDFGLEARLRAIADDPCPPDVIGVNHYLTSDRFLDHRRRCYPAATVGGAYADVEAVRVLSPGPPGFKGALREAWARYRIPLALTEVHNGCTREEQLRWLAEAWRDAEALRAEGVDVRALTIWSLFGSKGWDRLLTGGGSYETGVFDASGDAPRATALATLLPQLAEARTADHPALAGRCWWRRDLRLEHSVVHRAAPLRAHLSEDPPEPSPPIAIVAADERVTAALIAACIQRDLAFTLAEHPQADGDLEPWCVLADPIPREPEITLPARCAEVLDAAIDAYRVPQAAVRASAGLGFENSMLSSTDPNRSAITSSA